MDGSNTEVRPMQLALGPLLYCWTREQVLAFYEQASGWPIEIIYLGEVVCSKRRALSLDEWLELAKQLESAGKQVVLSTLTLLEAGSELGALRRLCGNGHFDVEANDMAAVNVLAEAGVGFIAGPTLNIYNSQTLAVLAGQGMGRWVLPFELSQQAARELIDAAPAACPCEVFAWGRLPLSWSARCYTARAENRAKDQCEIICRNDPDGRLMFTREGQPFLTVNGVQMQSALTQNLAPWIPEMEAAGVRVLRLSPQSSGMDEVVGCFDRLRRDPADQEVLQRLKSLASVGVCDGYWHGEAGFANTANGSQQP